MEGASGGMIGAALVALAVLVAAVGAAVLGQVVFRELAFARARRAIGVGEHVVVGVRCLRPGAKWMLARVARVQHWATQAVKACACRNRTADEEAVTSVLLACAVVAACVGFALGRHMVWALVGAAAAVVAGEVAVSRLGAKDGAALREQTPEVLRAVGRCLQAGMTLQQTFAQVAQEVPGQFGRLFMRAADMMETGSAAGEALAYLRVNCEVPELTFLAVALDVQHQTGGSMGEVLDAAEKTVTARLDLARQLQTQTTQARLSAEVVTLLPFVLLGVLSVMSPGFLEPLFSGVAGYAVLAIAALLQIAGICMVRRILGQAQ